MILHFSLIWIKARWPRLEKLCYVRVLLEKKI